jgi:Flp pilus assembly protein TadB
MFFVTPTYFQPMFANVVGWALIVVAAFLIFIGNLIIRRIVQIEV